MELDHCAYDLRPGLPPEGLPREEAYRGRSYPAGYLEHLQQTAREAGIDMQRPAIVANTRKAHEATEFARDNGRLGEFARAVFAGYWEQARNISEIDVLCDIGGEAGVDWANVGSQATSVTLSSTTVGVATALGAGDGVGGPLDAPGLPAFPSPATP